MNKNLKKVISSVAALTMVASSVAAFAVDFPDVESTASYAQAVQELSALDVISGYDDGTFGPDKLVTRAEITKMIVDALAERSSAEASTESTKFADVSADHWAKGYKGTSYHYLPASRSVELDKNIRDAIERTFLAQKIPFRECITWTTDGFFRETQDMVKYRRAEGCTTVEMECAALAACARKRGASFGQILYTADSLANVLEHDERDWGKDSLRKALALCIAVLQAI